MPKVAGVKFDYSLKLSECLYDDLKLGARDFVVVSGNQGIEIGQVVYFGKKPDAEITDEKNIIRVATDDDIKKKLELEDEAKKIFTTFVERVAKHNLKMNPIGVSFSLDEAKVIFYYTSDGRVDFRELAKDLSRSLKKQAILRQIGPRDEAKLIGGYGRCGLPVCCATFMTTSYGITMGDAEKAYGMPKNAAKVSGLCGRLMCCIKFEENGEGKKKEVKK
jgi:cell fate regulator YaaT (PSP1 superfamily)